MDAVQQLACPSEAATRAASQDCVKGHFNSAAILPTPRSAESAGTCEDWSSGSWFNNVHNTQAGVPAENVLAMYDAACEFGS